MGFIASFFIDYRIRLIRKIIHKNLSYLIPFAQKVLKTNYQITPLDYADLKSTQSKSSQFSYGYFDHWKYVEEAWSTFGIELSAALSKIDLPELLPAKPMHFRFGRMRQWQQYRANKGSR